MNMSDPEGRNDTERRVLAMVRDVLTRVAKDTAAAPGTRHVLSDGTIDRIRECLVVISTRELELSGRQDDITAQRPRYPGQATRRDRVELSVESILSEGEKKSH